MSIQAGDSVDSMGSGNDLAHTPALLLMFAVTIAARFHGAQFLPAIQRMLDDLFGGPALARLPRELQPVAGMLPFALAMAALAAVAIVFARTLASALSRVTGSAQLRHN
jgi:hypothetical protein